MDVALNFIAVFFITLGYIPRDESTVCGHCVNEPATDYINKRVTTGVLWTDPNIQTRIECASRSHLFPIIKAFGFNENARECVAYTIPLSVNPANVAESGFNMFSTCAPVDGGFTSWSTWGPPCTATCGPSLSVTKTRTRSCTNPPPDKGGANCTGDFSETADINCELPICPIHGAWSTWGAWSGSCSITCGSAYYQQFRSRACTNPSPQYGGNSCPYGTTESRSMSCGTLPGCPVNGVWGLWSSWSGCTATCDTGGGRSRSRSCNNPSPSNGGSSCSGSSSESAACGTLPCPVMDSVFGTCTTSCSGTNVVCEQGKCVCDIFYNYKSGLCIQGCATYSSSFTSFYDKVLNGYNDKIVNDVMTLLACKNLCIAETTFLCVTADWDMNSHTCYMSQTTWFDATSGTSTSTSYYMLIRNCA